ncbi:hypothetical protein JQ557_03605 [Bradyrhizobium sp. U87765 SZCCT0131]|uniref:DUF6282 family protein n=1 Tax=unclassified Bradyrhizobium TaxID=2631580 RepID=UPI001BAAFBC7|nr:MULTISPECIES: DUF6282 family protein [unclassified Bradyrhizobium]MBR1217062.1 hypothetical protein [Bradyrhizobium sp. U87765 SZCCT0131]MBR1259182.1 hypothetical protein [Bradyrhizobium sp. U87765 SZCCT0134]MBR1305323.1 hypothetical protein [Bradyrhizobium sp. U87765 SZCCT0110]MBR1321109.1 hypothetical protein [Bradyrhizobium sp. U87765 SZCCT0109]MBR1350237.1 hypothetical protein [Bradyrhizobium sp. U87765 SZCCT0048]
MAETQTTYPDTVPLPPLSRPAEVAELLVGAVDLHCHSGPAAMPRILDHHEELVDAAAAGFRAVLYKDHFYPGMAHAILLEKLFPETHVRLFSGVALNNAVGGINPHAVDHAIKLGGKIVWMPTLSAANHIAVQKSGQAKTFPKTSQKMLDPMPLSALDANGRLTDDTRKVIDLIAEADIILSGGHLHASELHLVFDEAVKRGVRKMMVNHPTYIVGCTDTDIRQLVRRGVVMEHSICMFIDGKSKKYSADDLAHLIEVAGVDKTILSSDLGLTGSQRPVDGFRSITQMLLDLQMPRAAIKKLIGDNAAAFLDLPASRPAARTAA